MDKYYADCPTCKYHPIYKEGDHVGALCLNPLGELYRSEFDALHQIAPCSGWTQKVTP